MSAGMGEVGLSIERTIRLEVNELVVVLERQADVAELEAIDRILAVEIEPLSERQADALVAQESALLVRRQELVARLWPKVADAVDPEGGLLAGRR